MHAQSIAFLKLLNGDIQYVVPLWQRRYCWKHTDIERLIDDLLAVADAGPQRSHYAGNLLTYPARDTPPGVTETFFVVDGQQRLTTVSILLACIANKLDREGPCGEWTPKIIRDNRLTNPHMGSEKLYKLRLQGGDNEEFQQGFNGKPNGAGPVGQAWRITERLIRNEETSRLLRGLQRLRVVSIGLGINDDPQQIFESLNATGRPLSPSDKIKNWLLIGLPESLQRDLHRECWEEIERALGAEHDTRSIDVFFRDVMRWWTGEVPGIKHTYEELRRWALGTERDEDRPSLCRDLAKLAPLYGMLTGTAPDHPDRRVAKELRHLRAMRSDVHRPLMLRLLSDWTNGRISDHDLAQAAAGIGAWVTRRWLADRETAGMNRAIAELAHRGGPTGEEQDARHWLDQIRKLRYQRVAVPTDEEVREGIRTRKAYGGPATGSTFAILCELMEEEHPGEAPERGRLTVEHVMPQKLTDEWRAYLGEDAEELHGRYQDRLANLTLSGDVINSRMGAGPFAEKCKDYSRSSIGMTRRIAKERVWNEEAMLRRAEDLAHRALVRWPWSDHEAAAPRPLTEDISMADFWTFLNDTGGVPGQEETWVGEGNTMWLDPDENGDFIGISVGSNHIRMYIRTRHNRPESVARIRRFSQDVRELLVDQELGNDRQPQKTDYVEYAWMWDNEEEWPDACRWIRDQCRRLREIMGSSELVDG